MTTEALIEIALFVAVAMAVLVGALLARRMIGRTGHALRELDERLSARVLSLPLTFGEARERLIGVNAGTERALSSLSRVDERLEATRSGLADRRAASDQLRERLLEGRTTLARVRETARLVMRAIELRRTFLG